MKSMLTGLVGLGLVFAATGCGDLKGDAHSSVQSSTLASEKIGLLWASHGDIDNAAKELEDYIKVSFQKNPGIPLPFWSRGVLTGPAYLLSVKTVREQYDLLGPTNYRSISEAQAAEIDKQFAKVLPNAKTYLGYNFISPYVDDTVAQMKKDGITTIVVMNKGAQFSYASSAENMEDVLKSLEKKPDYDVKVYGVTHYDDDARFVDVMAAALRDDAARLFPGKSPAQVCLMLGSHGLPTWLIKKGDPAIEQMKNTVERLRKALPEYKIYHGFLNDDFIPGAEWVKPDVGDLAPTLVEEGCENVLMDGRLSFTTHHRATLFDMNIEVKKIFAEKSAEMIAAGQRKEPVNAILAPNFDSDPRFAKFIAEKTKDILELKGNSILLKDKGEKAMAPGSVGKPGVVIPGVTLTK